MDAILKRRRRLLVIVLSCFLATAAFAATNGTVQINAGSGATYKVTYGGSVIRPDAEPPALPANFRFFSGTAAPNPTVPTAFIPSGSTKPDADTYKYDFEGAGQYVTVLAEDSDHYGWTHSGYTYYGGAYHYDNILLSGTDPKTFELNFALEYQKATPYRPSGIGIQESQVRIGETLDTQTTLTITITPDTGTSPDKREIRGGSPSTYALLVVKSGDTWDGATTATGGNVSIDRATLINHSGGTIVIRGDYLVGGASYAFTAWNRNFFSTSSDDNVTDLGNKLQRTWTLLGAGMMVGPETVTIHFRTTDDLGINPFSFPFANLTDPAGVTNLRQLIEAVNTEAGENVVTVAGWWNKERQEPWGYIITYNSSALNDFGTFTTAGEVPTDPSAVSLEKDMAYQFSVLRPVSIDATGTR